MDVNNHFNTINTFEDFDKFLTKANVKVTFWSHRVIKVKNYSGTLKIDNLVNKFISLIKSDIDFDESIRPFVKKVSNSIDGFYEKTDIMMKFTNILTRFFNRLTYIFSKYNCPDKRWNWNKCDGYAHFIMSEDEADLGYHHICNLYTKNQYQNTFNKIPPIYTTGNTIKGFGNIYVNWSGLHKGFREYL